MDSFGAETIGEATYHALMTMFSNLLRSILVGSVRIESTGCVRVAMTYGKMLQHS